MVTTGFLDREVYVHDLKLHYQEWGNPRAPAILMLHGFGVSGHMFDEFGARMEDRYHLIALDQRGHGDSEWSQAGDYSRDAFVSDVEGFRKALGLERFILMGHSMGGLNAVSYAATYPERVRALVLVDVGPEAAKEGVDNIVRFTRGPDELEFEEFVRVTHQFNPRRTVENIRERMRYRLRPLENGKWTWKFDSRFRDPESKLRIGADLGNDETWQLYRSVPGPTLLVRGAESDVLTADVAERAAREMQRARLVVVPGAGHSVPGDNPDDFTAAVAAFLEDIERGAMPDEAAAEPPPLGELVRPVATQGRGRPGSLAFLLVAAGAIAALAGGVYVARRRGQHRARSSARGATGEGTSRDADRLRRVHAAGGANVEAARRRAADLALDLAAAGRASVARVRARAPEVDVERARAAAHDVLQLLGEHTRGTPAAVRGAVARVDRKKLARRRAAARRVGGTALQLATIAGLRLIASRSGGDRRKGTGR